MIEMVVAIFCLFILANVGLLLLLLTLDKIAHGVAQVKSKLAAMQTSLEAIDAELALYAKMIGEAMRKREEQEASAEKQRIVNGGVEPFAADYRRQAMKDSED